MIRSRDELKAEVERLLGMIPGRFNAIYRDVWPSQRERDAALDLVRGRQKALEEVLVLIRAWEDHDLAGLLAADIGGES